jgi:glycerol-3-phosphate O-acyltransferase
MFQNQPQVYPQLEEQIEKWAITRQSDDRDAFVKEVIADSENRILEEFGEQLPDLLSKTIYAEIQRTKHEPWKVDPPKEQSYWKKLSTKLARRSLDETEAASAEQAARKLLRRILNRYTQEIVGTFKVGHFRFARRFLSFFFGRLLNAAVGRSFRSIFSSKAELKSKLLVKGYVDDVRSLYDKGSVVIVPTHFSNIDSIMIGYILDAVAGLPASAYGAGLNLYNTGYTAYFMNRLGAYRVDRRKSNPIYNRTLKQMAKLSIKRGVPNIFFPGGTRSRSGSLERKLKLGLLSSAMEAQREMYQEGKSEKVFIVPLVMSYPFVLEAQYLVEQHLRQQGQDRYIKIKDNFHSLRSIVKFSWGIFNKANRITISLGQPMDVLGNRVDAEGNSYGGNDIPVDTKEYFRDAKGEVSTDYQRESEYLKMLGDRIVDRFHRDNVVISSHLVSYAAFVLFEHTYPKLDLYGLLRLPTDDFVFDRTLLLDLITQLRDLFIEMEQNDEIKISDTILATPEEILKSGIRSLGNFHVEKPLTQNSNGQLVSENFSMLYFYHNRLVSYQFDKQIDLPSDEKLLSVAEIA